MAKRSSRRRRSSPSRSGKVEQTPASDVDLAAEYSYVIEDLRRIGVIAAILIGALVALSFVF